MRYIEVAKTIKELARNIPQLLSSEGGYKMPSLKDLAKECGVSVATVSKALNGQPDIAPATRERICAALPLPPAKETPPRTTAVMQSKGL